LIGKLCLVFQPICETRPEWLKSASPTCRGFPESQPPSLPRRRDRQTRFLAQVRPRHLPIIPKSEKISQGKSERGGHRTKGRTAIPYQGLSMQRRKRGRWAWVLLVACAGAAPPDGRVDGSGDFVRPPVPDSARIIERPTETPPLADFV